MTSLVSNKHKISVLHLRSSTGNGGGPEKTILNSLIYVDRNIVDMAVIYLKKKRDSQFNIANKAKHLGVDNFYVIEESTYFDRKAMRKIAGMIDLLNVDILHTHDFKSDWWGWLLRKGRPKLRLITTFHGQAVTNTKREVIYYHIGKLPLYFYDWIIAVDKKIVHSLRKIGIPKKKIVIVPNAIDSNLFRSSSPPDLNGRELTIGYIGRLSMEKRLEDLIIAFDRIDKARVGRLMIAGDGPRLKYLQLLISKLGLTDKVKLMGHFEPRSFFEQVDIFVNPSLKEGLPNTILESMSMGTLVIGTLVGGVGDVLKHMETGLVIPTRSPEKIKEMINFSLNYPEISSKMIDHARLLICKEYDFNKRMRHIEQIYTDAVDKKSLITSLIQTEN